MSRLATLYAPRVWLAPNGILLVFARLLLLYNHTNAHSYEWYLYCVWIGRCAPRVRLRWCASVMQILRFARACTLASIIAYFAALRQTNERGKTIRPFLSPSCANATRIPSKLFVPFGNFFIKNTCQAPAFMLLLLSNMPK